MCTLKRGNSVAPSLLHLFGASVAHRFSLFLVHTSAVHIFIKVEATPYNNDQHSFVTRVAMVTGTGEDVFCNKDHVALEALQHELLRSVSQSVRSPVANITHIDHVTVIHCSMAHVALTFIACMA